MKQFTALLLMVVVAVVSLRADPPSGTRKTVPMLLLDVPKAQVATAAVSNALVSASITVFPDGVPNLRAINMLIKPDGSSVTTFTMVPETNGTSVTTNTVIEASSVPVVPRTASALRLDASQTSELISAVTSALAEANVAYFSEQITEKLRAVYIVLMPDGKVMVRFTLVPI